MNPFIKDAEAPQGYIAPDALVAKLHITKKEFALAIGLSQDDLIRMDRRESVATQLRLRQTIEILNRIETWAGSISAAWSWYRSYSIAPLGGLTAEELVVQGRTNEVHEYVFHIAEGGYA